MNELWISAGRWLLHTALGGGLLLLVTCVLMRFTRQPARRQRLGDWGLSAALVVGLLSLVGPSWLVIAWNRGADQRRTVIENATPADDGAPTPQDAGKGLPLLEEIRLMANPEEPQAVPPPA